MAHARHAIRQDIEARLAAIPLTPTLYDNLEKQVTDADFPCVHVWLELDTVTQSGADAADVLNPTLSHDLALRLVASAQTMAGLEDLLAEIEVEMANAATSGEYDASYPSDTEFGDPLELGIEAYSAVMTYRIDYTTRRKVPATAV